MKDGAKSRAHVLGLPWGRNICLLMEDAPIDPDTTPSHRESTAREIQRTAVLRALHQGYGHYNLEE